MSDQSFLRYLQGAVQSFNPYGAGEKVYEGGRTSPNLGPTTNRMGYDERDRMARAKRNAMLRRMKSTQRGRYMSPEVLRRRTYNG